MSNLANLKSRALAPNSITYIRFLMAPIYILAILHHPLYAVAILLIASLSDWLDGHLARKYNMQTDLGALLDPLADKAMTMACLAMINLMIRDGPLMAASALIVARDIVLSIFRLRGKNKQTGNQYKVSDLAKVKTAILFLSQILLNFYLYANIGLVYALGSMLLYASSLLTMISFWQYFFVKRS